MKRTWVIPAMLVAGVAGLGGLTYAASAQNGNGCNSCYVGEGSEGGDGWSGQRWRDDDRGGNHERGQRWRDNDDDRRGYGPREGRRSDDDCGPRGRGWGYHGRGHGMHQGYGRGRDGMERGYDRREDRGYDSDRDYDRREGRRDGWREGRRFERDDSDRGYGRGWRHGRHGGMGRGGMFDSAAELDSIKRELSVTAQQEAAWTKYAGAVKEAADAMKTRREAMRAGAARDLSVEDHRKFRDSMMEQRRKEIDAVRTAADELIKSLDEKQVAIAKEVLPGYAFGPWMRGAGMGMGMGAGGNR